MTKIICANSLKWLLFMIQIKIELTALGAQNYNNITSKNGFDVGTMFDTTKMCNTAKLIAGTISKRKTTVHTHSNNFYLSMHLHLYNTLEYHFLFLYVFKWFCY